MRPTRTAIAAALIGAAAATAALTPALAQQAGSQAAPTTRLRGVIDKVDGGAVLAKSSKGDELKLRLVDKALVVAVVKVSMADIKPGLFIGSGAMPQPDGSQQALEVHIFAESMRGTGEGHRPWDGAPNATMTNERFRRRRPYRHRPVQGRRKENYCRAERSDRALRDRRPQRDYAGRAIHGRGNRQRSRWHFQRQPHQYRPRRRLAAVIAAFLHPPCYAAA
jgi:hypothetical protein